MTFIYCTECNKYGCGTILIFDFLFLLKKVEVSKAQIIINSIKYKLSFLELKLIFRRGMDDDIIRILVATDNHLGYLGKDTVRSNDSFAAFEEVLITARKEKADFVLLAGDLFHENKPSRKTIHASIDILRKYCTGSDDVYIEILNNQEDIFKNRERKVNYENPFESICLPIFAIHGNHDDPSRDGISEPLSALDILSVSNLINYFGKSDQVDDIEITPILLQKANTRIALYGLGAVRDERLNRMWANKKVKFVKPTAEQV
jgi:double-strand break repair protein MRE11